MALCGGPGERGLPPIDLIATSQAARMRIEDATGLIVDGELPAPEWIDREDWVGVNAANLGRLLAPLLARAGDGLGLLAGPARIGAGAIATAEAAALLGLVGGRVLGQYDVALGGAQQPDIAPRLLFVAPNIMGAADALEADAHELLTWIVLHEVTHAVQFSGVLWLRGHVSTLIDDLMAAMDVKLDPRALARGLSIDQMRSAAEDARRRGLAALLGPARGDVLDRVQALMGLIEGHAEWAMDVVAPDLVPNVASLRAAMRARRGERSGLWRLLDGMLGIDLKMRQYDEGRRFCDAVVEVGGPALLHQAWAAPEMVPTLAELADPASWRARVAE